MRIIKSGLALKSIIKLVDWDRQSSPLLPPLRPRLLRLKSLPAPLNQASQPRFGRRTAETSTSWGRTTDAADHVHIRVSLGAGASTMLIAGSNWTQREVIPALEAQTGRSLRGRYFVLAGKALRGGRTLRDLGVREGSELEVRHRRHGGVNTSDVTPKVGRPQSEYVDEVREKLAEVTVRLGARSGAAGSGKAPASSTGAQMFEETTPMLVMPFPIFLAQGRIMKSTKAWREEALEKQWLVAYDESSGKVVIFVSHT